MRHNGGPPLGVQLGCRVDRSTSENRSRYAFVQVPQPSVSKPLSVAAIVTRIFSPLFPVPKVMVSLPSPEKPFSRDHRHRSNAWSGTVAVYVPGGICPAPVPTSWVPSPNDVIGPAGGAAVVAGVPA